ncbi:arylsulfatase A-like enzyme [Microbacterium thalassium]|uniref:Arylsulfatase A-like enzyme n=1 Tax=Microbacterium thalassium TaxID=362649 RepID=A0A7X0KVU8_9MICO|nr:sulfatase-like hydrolase/transferase [Microbacterium thalassium]MBB6392568.1 arylsulfatase A-like enzyme [Microbacterium thalassium]GLK23201.1 arylsulfatase [Microbacterium thalassium]
MSTELPPEPVSATDQEAAERPPAKRARKGGLGKRILKSTGLILALPATLLMAGVGYALFELATNRPDDSPEHEARKEEYVSELSATMPVSGETPNVLLVHYDDLGYGDLGFMGDTPIQTPNLDALAADGVVMTNYHAPSAVCTPSRAALLTGRMAPRAAVPDVLFPNEGVTSLINVVTGTFGLTQAELTIPDILQASGYDTAMIGKWHIGDTEGSTPNDFGFDSFLGSLYSNDMVPFQIYEDREVVLETVDQTQLDELYTDRAVEFVGAAGETEDPFFLYFAHNFPHEPLYAAAENQGRSDAGLYGDVVEGLDDGIGRIVDELEATGQLDNTIIMVTSDNGPWFQGDGGDHRGRKGSISEGGTLVPFLVHWPEGIEGGRTVDTMAMGTDVLPTLLDWLDIPAPTDRTLDGTSMAPVLAGTSDTVSEFYYYYASKKLLAVSDGRFKYYAAQPYLYGVSGTSFATPFSKGPWLFDLDADPSESYDVIERYPEAAAALAAELERRNAETDENPRGWKD